jgi:hypothetical protein
LLGIYITDREVDAVLDQLYAANAPPDADTVDTSPIAALSALIAETETSHRRREEAALDAGASLRLRQLAERLELDDFEQQVVLLALAPALDRHYDRLFAYLNDDAAHRWPSVGLALQLFCADLRQRVSRQQALALAAPLRSLRLIHLIDEQAPLGRTRLACGLRLDERIVSYLSADDAPDPMLSGLVHRDDGPHISPVLDSAASADVLALHNYFARKPSPPPILAISGPDREQQMRVAAWLAHAWMPETPLLSLEGSSLLTHPDPEDVAARLLREVRLTGAVLAVHDADALQKSGGRAGAALNRLLEADSVYPRFLLMRTAWAPTPYLRRIPILMLELAAPDRNSRRELWAGALNGRAAQVDLAELADRFRLTSAQIAAAATQAQTRAAANGNRDLVTQADLYAGCRTQSNHALGDLAQRIESIHAWDDLILPPATKNQLRSLENWIRFRHVVYGEWGYDRRVMLGRGLAVLFSGPSGTGKTMAAGILARNLSLDLYRVDLSTVVSKYIGETEKNLSRIFEVAESANAILFFDEADALFGKRSEVKDAHDRYANIEVSYLLQQMEAYEGMAILATNFRENLDQAFARRLYSNIAFPMPQSSDRERIWRHLLPDQVPQSDDIDLAYLAEQFNLSGGSIKNCVLAAAFAAAAEGVPIQMRHLVQAVARELDKIEQPVTRSEFGAYYDLLRMAHTPERNQP